MIVFKEKTYSEFEAMRTLYTELGRAGLLRGGMYDIINTSQLIPILKGNNVVIEKFVISTSLFGKDKYRMYLKIGAKAKLPDEVRLPGRTNVERLGKISFNFKNNTGGGGGNNNNNGNGNNRDRNGRSRGGNNNNQGGNQQKQFGIEGSYNYQADIQLEVQNLLGEAIKYDKKARELILEFDSVQDAIRALNILPFGIRYKTYLLET
jgi:hypothetical protein